MKLEDNDIPFWLILYSVITVIAALFAPPNTPESVKISILVSGQTSLAAAAGMSRTGKSKEINNQIENVEALEQQTEDSKTKKFVSSEKNEPYK